MKDGALRVVRNLLILLQTWWQWWVTGTSGQKILVFCINSEEKSKIVCREEQTCKAISLTPAAPWGPTHSQEAPMGPPEIQVTQGQSSSSGRGQACRRAVDQPCLSGLMALVVGFTSPLEHKPSNASAPLTGVTHSENEPLSRLRISSLLPRGEDTTLDSTESGRVWMSFRNTVLHCEADTAPCLRKWGSLYPKTDTPDGSRFPLAA